MNRARGTIHNKTQNTGHRKTGKTRGFRVWKGLPKNRGNRGKRGGSKPCFDVISYPLPRWLYMGSWRSARQQRWRRWYAGPPGWACKCSGSCCCPCPQSGTPRCPSCQLGPWWLLPPHQHQRLTETQHSFMCVTLHVQRANVTKAHNLPTGASPTV